MLNLWTRTQLTTQKLWTTGLCSQLRMKRGKNEALHLYRNWLLFIFQYMITFFHVHPKWNLYTSNIQASVVLRLKSQTSSNQFCRPSNCHPRRNWSNATYWLNVQITPQGILTFQLIFFAPSKNILWLHLLLSLILKSGCWLMRGFGKYKQKYYEINAFTCYAIIIILHYILCFYLLCNGCNN